MSETTDDELVRRGVRADTGMTNVLELPPLVRVRTNLSCSTKGVYTHETTVEVTGESDPERAAVLVAAHLRAQDETARAEIMARETTDRLTDRRFS